MKYLPTFVSLVATASAVDLYYHGTTNCDTGVAWVRCSNINPDTCCAYNAGIEYLGSIAIRGIVQGWNIQLRGYTGGGNCAGLSTITGNGGASHICKRGVYTGQGYNFVGKKRAEPAGNSECQRPDTLGLPDGTEFDLAGLEDEDFRNM